MVSSFGSADFIVIGEAHDRVASEVYRRACAKGLCVRWPDRSVFARETSITVDGVTTIVDPDVPVLLRRQAMVDDSSEDGLFLAAEVYSQVWAAGALMKSPVVNRPTLDGMPDWHPRVQATRLRSCGWIDPLLLVPERHTSTASLPSADYESDCIWLPPAGTAGCGYRSRRRKPADWRYVRCCVVGDRVLRPAQEEGIAEPSLSIARALKIEFCLIHWRVNPAGDAVKVARVDTHPQAVELGEFFDDAVDTLIGLLLR